MRIMEYRQEMEEGPTKNVRDVGRKIMQKCRDVGMSQVNNIYNQSWQLKN